MMMMMMMMIDNVAGADVANDFLAVDFYTCYLRSVEKVNTYDIVMVYFFYITLKLMSKLTINKNPGAYREVERKI